MLTSIPDNQEDWNKDEIITLVGHMTKHNTFRPINSDKEYSCTTYRCNAREIKGGPLCCVNIKWKGGIFNVWCIFQFVIME